MCDDVMHLMNIAYFNDYKKCTPLKKERKKVSLGNMFILHIN